MSEASEALLGEIVPAHENTEEIITTAAIIAMTSVWRKYYATDPEQRLGDEESMDARMPGVLIEIGIDPTQAQVLHTIAKLNAQL